jgi:hypothetical protein
LPLANQAADIISRSPSPEPLTVQTLLNMRSNIFALAALVGAAAAQQVGKEMTETHPKMTWQKCSAGGSCSNVNGEITIDSNWRWVHEKNGFTNCYSGASWDTDICKDPKTCASNCAVDGAAYAATYGASTSGNALTLKFITEGEHCRFIVCPLGGGVRGVADHDCQLPTLDRVCT